MTREEIYNIDVTNPDNIVNASLSTSEEYNIACEYIKTKLLDAYKNNDNKLGNKLAKSLFITQQQALNNLSSTDRLLFIANTMF